MRRCLWIAICVLLVQVSCRSTKAQDLGGLETYFTGKEVVLKIDMPGSQKGVDINVNKEPPLNWKDYGNRVKLYGLSIPKGATSRITALVVKKDRIEFQLDGGGFGTFGDNSSTTVLSRNVNKSDYEKQLEKDIANSSDDDHRKRLQRDLDRERDRLERQQAANDRTAQVASQMKAAQVADSRLGGGSRFNLRWSNRIPEDQLTPDTVMHVLADYVDFGPMTASGSTGANTAPAAPIEKAAPKTAELHNGMSEADVNALFGNGNTISHATTNGLKTEDIQYQTSDREVVVTYVNGIVVRYAISSR